MRQLKLSLLLFLCAFFLMGCSHQEKVLQDNQNHAIPLSDLRGKWIVINYWADWCDYCVEEMHTLNEFHQTHPDVIMYGVNYDRLTGDELSSSIQKMKIRFPVLLNDPESTWHLTLTDYLPMTFIINPNGQLVKRIDGTVSTQSLTQAIQQV